MKLFSVLLVVLFSQSVFAKTALDRDIEKLQKLAEVGTNGGDSYISTYKPTDSKFRYAGKQLLESIRGNDCEFTASIGLKRVMTDVGQYLIYWDSNAAHTILDKLYKAGKIKTAVGYYWDGENGDSEYCTVEQLTIFFTNGKMLDIYLDSTT